MTPQIFAQKLTREFDSVRPLGLLQFIVATSAGHAEVLIWQLPDKRLRCIAYSDGRRFDPEVMYTQLRLDLDAVKIAKTISEMIAAVAKLKN